jgi:Ca2+-binding EF-hand superfamily protein
VATIELHKLINEGTLAAAFDAFDQDRSGDISVVEIRTMFGGHIDDEIWRNML